MALPSQYSLDAFEPYSATWDRQSITRALVEIYRCPEEFLQFELSGKLSSKAGFFEWNDITCYGRSVVGHGMRVTDTLLDLRPCGSRPGLQFDPTEVINNLRLERYALHHRLSELRHGARLFRDLYYLARPSLNLRFRKHLQRAYHHAWDRIVFPSWPVDTTVERISDQMLFRSMKERNVDRAPFVWFWPHGARSTVVMTHDVEADLGYDFCGELMAIDASFDIKASFQIVPEGSYRTSDGFLQDMRDGGFEVNIQDLNHDGRLFGNLREFRRRASKINQYTRAYEANGFRAAVMYRNQDWYESFDFSYDMSVPNVAHLDPQRGGCCTVMPYFIGDILEIPLTTTQDYMLFHLLGDYSLDLWKTQAEKIIKRNGLISFLVHPDYVRESKAQRAYCDLLVYLRDLRAQETLWFALPGEVDRWWRDRSQMQIVKRGGHWRIEGSGAERAVLAFARAAEDGLEFELSAEPS